MIPLSLSLIGLVLASPPPDWQLLPAPEGHAVERVAWSADGARLAVCGSDAVSVLEAPTTQTILAAHGCQDIIFDGADVIYAVQDTPQDGVWRAGSAAPKRLTKDGAQALLLRGGRLWIAGRDLAVHQGGTIVARAALVARRLIATPAGVLAVTAKDVRLLDDKLTVVRTFTPDPAPSPNGLYDAVALPDGRVAAVDNGGSVWIWDAAGARIAHGQSIGNARWLVWTGQALIVGDTWLQLNPLRPVARAVLQPRAVGPAALSPTRRVAVPLHQGVLLRPASQVNALPRGMPSTVRGIVATADAVWVADDDGQLVHFNRQGEVQAVHPIATSKLRGLVGDPAKTLYAGTEWGHVIAWRPTGPYRRWPSRSTEHLALSRDGHTLYAGGQKTADRFDTRTGARTSMVKADEDYQPYHPTLTPEGDVIWFRGGHPGVLHAQGKAPVPIMPARSGGFDVRGRLWVSRRAGKPGLYGWPKRNKIKELPRMDEGRFVPLPDGGMVVTGWGGRVQAFTPDGAERWSKHAPWHVGGAAVLGDRLLTGGPDLTLSTWDLKTGARANWARPGRGQSVSDMAFSADGRRLAVGADATGVRVWDLQTHRVLRDLAVGEGDLWVARDGEEWLIHQHGAAYRWPVEGGAAREVALPELNRSSDGGGDPGGAYVLRTGDAKGHIVDLRTGKTLWTLRVPDTVRTAALSDDGQRVATLAPGAAQVTLRVHARGEPPSKGVTGPFNALTWHGDRLLVWQDEGVFAWSPKGLIAQPHLPNFAHRVARAGSRLALSDGKVVRVQDGAKLLRAFPVERYGGHHLALSPDGKVLAIGGTFTGSVVLWSVETGRPMARYEAFADGIWRSTTAAGAVATGTTIGPRRGEDAQTQP